MDPQQEIYKGEAMARFLENQVIREVFADLARSYHEEWKASDRPEMRERIWAQARALDDLLQVLQAVVDSGDRAKHDLQRGTRPT